MGICVCDHNDTDSDLVISPRIRYDVARTVEPVTLYQPMTHICVMSSHKPIRIYMGGLILGVSTLHRLFCFFKLFPMVGKGLTDAPELGLH